MNVLSVQLSLHASTIVLKMTPEQQVSVYWWSQVLDSKQTKKMTAQGQAQALTMLDT